MKPFLSLRKRAYYPLPTPVRKLPQGTSTPGTRLPLTASASSTPLTIPHHPQRSRYNPSMSGPHHQPYQQEYPDEEFIFQLGKATFGAKLEEAEYFILLKGCVERDLTDECLVRVMERMEIANIPKKEIFNALAIAFLESGYMKRAEQVLQVFGEVELGPACKLKPFFREHGLLDQVLWMLSEGMLSKDIQNMVNNTLFSAKVNRLVEKFALSQYLNEACQLFQWIKLNGIQPTTHTYNSLIDQLMRANMPDKAIDVALTMEYGMVDGQTFHVLLEGFLKNNLRDESVTLLEHKQAWKF